MDSANTNLKLLGVEAVSKEDSLQDPTVFYKSHGFFVQYFVSGHDRFVRFNRRGS